MKASILYSVTGPTGKVYFGITSRTLSKRWGHHCSDARRGAKTRLHRAIRKYGEDAFVIAAIVVGHRQYIEDAEIRIIAAYNSTDPKIGYNGSGGGVGVLGYKPSAKSIADLIARCKGKPRSDETIARIKAAQKLNPYRWTPERHTVHKTYATGRRPTPKTKAKMSVSMTGLKRTAEGCANISIAKTGVKTGPRGPMSDAHKAAISAGKKGKPGFSQGPMPAERKAKISATKAGVSNGPHSPETRAKISAAHIGKPKPRRPYGLSGSNDDGVCRGSAKSPSP